MKIFNYFKCSKWIPITMYLMGSNKYILMGRVKLRTGLYQFKNVPVSITTVGETVKSPYNANDQLQKLEWAGIGEITITEKLAPEPFTGDLKQFHKDFGKPNSV